MNVAYVEAVERSAVVTSSWSALAGRAGSPVLLCFSELRNNRDSLQLLARQLNSFSN